MTGLSGATLATLATLATFTALLAGTKNAERTATIAIQLADIKQELSTITTLRSFQTHQSFIANPTNF
ncbi:MAG: hypothetical protein AB2747_09925 [Candidatus Thiodiazotropha taylori]